ncbi:MAG: ABC transporter substrate-binding protein [Gammaproteobacteria bacterium]
MKTIMTITLCALLLGAPAASAAVEDPATLVERAAGDVLDQLAAREEEFRARPELLEDVVRNDLLPLLDIEYAARLILGREGRGASEAQLDAFADAMSGILISRYAEGLLEYRQREQLEVMPTRGELNERMTRVRTRVRLLNGNFVPVDYVFRLTDEGWKAFDVVIEGISYVTTYRNQLIPQVQESGLDAVTERLRRGELKLE